MNVIQKGGYWPWQPQSSKDHHELHIDGEFGAILASFVTNPLLEEVEEYNDNEVDRLFALYPYKDIMFMVFRIGRLQMQDVPFHVSMSGSENFFLQFPEGQGLAIHTLLVDIDTREIRAMHTTGLGNRLTNELFKLVNSQVRSPITSKPFNEQINEVYRLYPSPKHLLKSCHVSWVHSPS